MSEEEKPHAIWMGCITYRDNTIEINAKQDEINRHKLGDEVLNGVYDLFVDEFGVYGNKELKEYKLILRIQP